MSELVFQRHKIRKTRQALAAAGFRPDEIGAALCQGLGTLLLAAQENAQETHNHVATAIRSAASAHAARRRATGGAFWDIPEDSIDDKNLNEAFEFVESLMKQLMTEIAELYAAHFTEQEIKDILAFYKSPVGRKMITEEPKALDQSMSHAQAWAVKISDQVLVRMREEMKKKGHDL